MDFFWGRDTESLKHHIEGIRKFMISSLINSLFPLGLSTGTSLQLQAWWEMLCRRLWQCKLSVPCAQLTWAAELARKRYLGWVWQIMVLMEMPLVCTQAGWLLGEGEVLTGDRWANQHQSPFYNWTASLGWEVSLGITLLSHCILAWRTGRMSDARFW